MNVGRGHDSGALRGPVGGGRGVARGSADGLVPDRLDVGRCRAGGWWSGFSRSSAERSRSGEVRERQAAAIRAHA